MPVRCRVGKLTDSGQIDRWFLRSIDDSPAAKRSVSHSSRVVPNNGLVSLCGGFNYGDSVIIDARVQARMKPRSCTIWVLGLLLAIASVDAVPDPPAVNRPASSTASLVRKARVDVHERWLNPNAFISLLIQAHWITLTSAYEPNLPTDRIVKTGSTTDSSPPAV